MHLYYRKIIKCCRGKLSNLWWALFILSYIKLDKEVKVLTSARVGRILLSHLNKNVFLIQQMKIYSRENDQGIYSSLWKYKRENFIFVTVACWMCLCRMYADERESEKFPDWLKISQQFPSLYSHSQVKTSTKKWLITLLVRKKRTQYMSFTHLGYPLTKKCPTYESNKLPSA